MRNLILSVCILCSGVCFAQEKSVLEPGTTFFLPSISATIYPGTRGYEIDLSISITTEEKACVKIYGRDTIAFLEIDSFSYTEAFIPTNFLFFDSLYQSGVYIESDVPINVYASYVEKNTILGSLHRFSLSVINQNVFSNQKHSPFHPVNIGRTTSLPNLNHASDRFIIAQEIISHEDDNEIEVCFKGNVKDRLGCWSSPMSSHPECIPTHLAGTCTIVNLDKNQRIGFMMGEKIENKNFRELRYSTAQSLNQKGFSLYTRANAGLLNLEGCVTHSHLSPFYNTHQVIPENYWSNKYYLPPRPEHVVFLLTCFSTDTLEYSLNGDTLTSAIIDTAFYAQDLVIKANQPFGSITGTGANRCNTLPSHNERNFISHPLVDPEDYYHRTCFAPFKELDTVYNHYMVNIVIPTSGIGGIRHKGVNIAPTLFNPFRADPSYSWATIEIDTGYQFIESDSAFLGILYTYYRDSTFNFSNRTRYPAITHLLGATPHFKRDTSDRSFHVSYRNQKTPFQQYNITNEICPGDTVWFIPPAAANTLWVFDFDDGNKRVLQTQDIMKDSIAHVFYSSGYKTIIVYDSLGCLAGDSVMVYIQEETELNYEVNLGAECDAFFIELEVHNYEVDSAQWVLPGNIILDEKSTHTSLEFQELPFSVILKAWIGNCLQEEEILVSETNYIEGLEYVPNVFSPNGDGKNDCWQIGYKDVIRECYEVHIFNRWGQLMFHSNNPEECWDGTTQNKQPASEGVFFYRLKIGQQVHQGALQLYR
ncbi:MAG: gliding motility-associated C-terminal domain-containing protein [Cryomorphaceae bacterium]|nr:gliding motility-associated C-terminal domain-containing protein [Cryomorphaceae bacterium]